LHEKLQLGLCEEEQVYGLSTFASHVVLQNIKYEGNVLQRYSDD